jgi:putative SOS response-associated peptidase YedK
MCGRFTLTYPDYESLANALGVDPNPELSSLYRPRYNVAPTDPHWVLRIKDGKRQLLPAKWGLVNSWAPDMAGGARQINARSETAARSPAFRESFERRRCIVPADGFYEWVGEKKARRPIWYHPRDGGLLHLAGLYASWRNEKTGEWQRTFSILTTSANPLVRPVHDRMPAILPPEAIEAWLDPAPAEDAERKAELRALLRPAAPDVLDARPVSVRANSVKNDDAECLAAAEDAPAMPLFEKSR